MNYISGIFLPIYVFVETTNQSQDENTEVPLNAPHMMLTECIYDAAGH